jgi:hypothetical protein
MAIEPSPFPYPRCAWCGGAYRPSAFDREHCCPVCGHSLSGGTAGAKEWRPARYVPAAATFLVLAGIITFTLRSLPRQPIGGALPTLAPSPDLTPAFAPSEEFRSTLAERAGLLEQDLAQAPDDHFLLAALGETYLYRAVVELQVGRNPRAAQRLLRRATGYLNRLRGEPFATYRLRETVRRFPRLRFSTTGWPSVTASLWNLQAGKNSLFSAPAPGGVPYIRRRRDVTGLPAGNAGSGWAISSGGPSGGPPLNGPGYVPLFPGAAPGASPAPVFPGYPRGGAPMWNAPDTAPGPSTPDRPIPPGGSASAPAGPDNVAHLTRLRQQLAGQPTDPYAVDQLAAELLRQSAFYQPAAASSASQRQARTQIEEAAKLYTRAAGIARLRLHRAAFYAAAADARRRLEQWEEQYALLEKAAEAAPFATGVWHDLKTAALRLGKLDESLAAGKSEARWRLPGIEVVESAR